MPSIVQTISLRRHSNVMQYCSIKVTIVIHSSDILTKAGAEQVICGEKVVQRDLLQPYITSYSSASGSGGNGVMIGT